MVLGIFLHCVIIFMKSQKIVYNYETCYIHHSYDYLLAGFYNPVFTIYHYKIKMNKVTVHIITVSYRKK